MKTNTFKTARIVYLVALTLSLTGCLLEQESGTESGSSVVAEPTPVSNPLTPPEQTLCDPFSTNSPQARDRGLIASIMYMTDEMALPTKVSDVIDNGILIEATLYMDRLFVPTRPFDRGFTTQSGTEITNYKGEKLYEYFGLRAHSQLQLGADELPGYYQLALLADDGAVMRIPDGLGGEKVIVNNDGTHATKMGCASEPIWLDHDTKIPFTVDYYQGPKYHISLVAMMRPWPATDPVVDVHCGKSGNSYFFDSTVDPVQAKPNFYDLLSRNWKVLENKNFYFPATETNPCVIAEDPLIISNYGIASILRDRVTVSWSTNLPADSKVEVRNSTTGVIVASVDTATLYEHNMTVTGLSSFTLYSVKVTSTSAGGQTVISDELAFRTAR